MSKNIVIGAVVAIIFVSGISVIIYRDYKSGTNTGKTSDNTTTTATGDIDTLVREGKITVEEIPVETSIPAPSLNRPIPPKTGLDLAVQNRLIEQMNAIISSLKVDGKSFDDWLGLGILRKQLGDYAGAAEAWEYVSALYPDEVVSFANLGDLYENFLKNYPKAEKNMWAVVRINPNRIDGYRALYELYTEYYKEKSAEAPAVLSDGLEVNPGNYDLLVLLAKYYRDSGDKAKAKDFYEQALVAAQKNGETVRIDAIKEEIKKIGA